MFDIVTYALLKKQIGQAATGISKVEYIDGNLIFTLADGSTISTPLPLTSGVAGATINEEGSLIIEFSDGTTLTYEAATKKELAAAEEKINNLETSYNTLNEAHSELKNAFDDLGLSVVDGKLNITYEENE